MSIGQTIDTDFCADIRAPAGTDVTHIYSVVPVDLTGCTASFITSFGTFAAGLSVSVDGAEPETMFTASVPHASLPAPGVYTWRMLVTFPTNPAIVLQYGHGGFYVSAS